ncbi:MAG: hypothetical protein JXQ96_22615 [Cyclobacteriaceae bacterium]
MPTHQIHNEVNQTYFVTFTCHKWLPLFETTNLYDYFDQWFEYLSKINSPLLGYVIMPNHFHGLIHVGEKCSKNLNQLVGNGKRFLAYEIISRLKQADELTLLQYLSSSVSQKEKDKKKKHQIFIPSFDGKLCINRAMLETKLDYIHHNPARGKWSLIDDWIDYPYSSAGFYEKGIKNKFLRDYRDFY